MKATQQLHDLGQSLWLDNITRDILHNGTLTHYNTSQLTLFRPFRSSTRRL